MLPEARLQGHGAEEWRRDLSVSQHLHCPPAAAQHLCQLGGRQARAGELHEGRPRVHHCGLPTTKVGESQRCGSTLEQSGRIRARPETR